MVQLALNPFLHCTFKTHNPDLWVEPNPSLHNCIKHLYLKAKLSQTKHQSFSIVSSFVCFEYLIVKVFRLTDFAALCQLHTQKRSFLKLFLHSSNNKTIISSDESRVINRISVNQFGKYTTW